MADGGGPKLTAAISMRSLGEPLQVEAGHAMVACSDACDRSPGNGHSQLVAVTGQGLGAQRCGHELSLDLGSGELVQRLGVLTFSWT